MDEASPADVQSVGAEAVPIPVIKSEPVSSQHAEGGMGVFAVLLGERLRCKVVENILSRGRVLTDEPSGPGGPKARGLVVQVS